MKQKISPVSLLVGVLLVLLILLAALQYRWLGRVSVGEHELMKASLKIKTDSFCEDFDREITRAYSTFKMDADTFINIDRSGYGSRFDDWQKLSGHPQIVKTIFLARAEKGGQFSLARFDETSRQFVSTDWTIELGSLRKRFVEQANSNKKDIFRAGEDSIVEEIPALVSSIVTFKASETKSNFKQVNWEHPIGYTIVTLNLDDIKENFIPALARQYFSSGDTLDYKLTIFSRSDPKKVIYQSLPEDTDVMSSSSDVSNNLLNIGFDEVRKFSSERVYQSPNSSNREESGFTLVIPALEKDESNASGKIHMIDDSARWQLRASHRAGSLELAVADARRWNLAMSFGILLLLAFSMILIVILSRRAEQLARRQMEFVAGISHEFRTPLAVIHSLSENLAAGRISKNHQVKQYGATIHKDVRHLTEMVEQVLEFAGAQRSKYFYDMSPLDVKNLIEKILAANAALFQQGGWTIEKDIEPNLPLINADELALSRAIQNLISNAVKYGGDGDRTLKIKVYKDTESPKQEMNISVEDNGIGISPKDLPYIFQPFYRGREIADAQIHGSGLGLSLVKQIVEAHGGNITVESTPGKGSCFTLHLPL